MAETRSTIAVAVMAKAPVPGVAKTRLGREIGYEAAAELYEAFLLDTVDLLDDFLGQWTSGSTHAARFLICPDDDQASRLAELLVPPWTSVAQRRPRLMGGIADAFEAGFESGADVVLVTDADSPALPPEFVAECARLAEINDVVLGPTPDGGYYLIGARQAAAPSLPELLLTPTYDSATICGATLLQAERLELSTATGPVSFDVDNAAELAELTRIAAELPPARLRHTRQAIAHRESSRRREQTVGDPP